jgi:hypothetical protein
MTGSEALALEASALKRARAAGTSPAARALRSDVLRRAASRGGTLRCAETRRVAYRDVDKSYASHRPSSHGWSRGDFKTAMLPQSPSLSIAPKEPRLLERDVTKPVAVGLARTTTMPALGAVESSYLPKA